MTEQEQKTVIQRPEFFNSVRDRLRQILMADFQYDNWLRLDLQGIHVEFKQEGVDAHLRVGKKDDNTPIYDWTAPITWLGVS